jgi:hypothetical protein
LKKFTSRSLSSWWGTSITEESSESSDRTIVGGGTSITEESSESSDRTIVGGGTSITEESSESERVIVVLDLVIDE